MKTVALHSGVSHLKSLSIIRLEFIQTSGTSVNGMADIFHSCQFEDLVQFCWDAGEPNPRRQIILIYEAAHRVGVFL